MNQEQKLQAEILSNRNQAWWDAVSAIQHAEENAVSHDETFKYAMLIGISDFVKLTKAVDTLRDLIIKEKVKLPPEFGAVANHAIHTQSHGRLEERLAYLGTWSCCEHVEVYCGKANDYFEFAIFGPLLDGEKNRILYGGIKYYPSANDWTIHT